MKEILSSTGSLGVSRRQDERLYINGRYSDDPVEITNNFRRLTRIMDRHPQRFSRSVARGLVSDSVINHLSQNGLRGNIEVALPIRDFTGDNSMLVYLANNHPERTVITPVEQMIQETTYQKPENKSPVERVQQIINSGYSFTNTFADHEIPQVLDLWSYTFGWTEEEVKNLKLRLDAQQYVPPELRTVWFMAIKDEEGRFTSLAMAERLSLPGKDGKIVDIIESTEWKVRSDKEGNGLMPATVAMLNAQILSDLETSANGYPLIFAECNFQRRADTVGYAAGLRIPDRAHAPQIIQQNVEIQDDADVPVGRKRDFSFMHLPMAAIQQKYNRPQRQEMLQYIT